MKSKEFVKPSRSCSKYLVYGRPYKKLEIQWHCNTISTINFNQTNITELKKIKQTTIPSKEKYFF